MANLTISATGAQQLSDLLALRSDVDEDALVAAVAAMVRGFAEVVERMCAAFDLGFSPLFADALACGRVTEPDRTAFRELFAEDPDVVRLALTTTWHPAA